MINKKSDSYHHKDLHSAIIAEAAEMIATEGIANLTMRSIGLRLGVSRSAAYRHFKDKTSVLVAVAKVGFERLITRIESVDMNRRKSSVEKLRRIGEEYIRFALENRAHYGLMFGKEALTREDQPQLQDAASGLFDNIVNVIQTHQQTGALKRQDPKSMAYVAWSSLHGMASLLIEGQIKGPVDVDALIKQTTRTILDGMRAN